ncbi:MAG: M48 family metallopeptidase [Daejeonella sp.]
MAYIGLQAQIRKNNFRSTWLLLSFPLLLSAMCWAILFAITLKQSNEYTPFSLDGVNDKFFMFFPLVLVAVGAWFFIAFIFHNKMIMKATGSKPLERKEDKRVYNLLENLCISQGIAKMPALYIIHDDSLNAFASGIKEGSYAISISQGMIDKLDDEELKAVIGHELTHIQNRDTRMLIISIIFVGIFAFIAEMAIRMRFRSNKDKNGGLAIAIIVIAALAYFISMIIRFAISRQREYMADAGAIDMTKNSAALASALRKISQDPCIEAVQRKDVAQLFIENPQVVSSSESSWFQKIFSTHPPINDRIAFLEKL